VAYLAHGLGYQVQLASTEVIVSVLGSDTREQPEIRTVQNLRVQFEGANSRAEVQGLDQQLAISNYLLGSDPSQHITGVRQFARVKVIDLYPGIDVVYYGKQGELEFDLIVKPGASLDQVKFRFDGPAEPLQEADGALLLRTEAGAVRLLLPIVYQDLPEGRRRVDARFVLSSGVAQLSAAEFDPRYALIVDPVLSYSDLLGGSSGAYGISIAVDGSGQSYVAGWTKSTNFPITSGVYDRSISNGDTDVFVAKINAAGTALSYSTFLGGRNGVDFATGLKIDSSGNVYVTGRTSGSDFPTTASAYQTGVAGGGSFVAKLSPTGTALTYSTYLRNATTRGIAVDANGNAVVVGDAASTFLTTAGGYQPTSSNASGRTGFAFKLNSTGSAAVFSTFLGGSNGDEARAVALDASGNVYIAGTTTSANFPLSSPFQGTTGSARDGFVSKLNSGGTALIYSTFLGGAADDWANAIAVDGSGAAYIAGTTGSTNFPVLNAFRATKGGKVTGRVWWNGFVTKLSPAGNALSFSSYLGGDLCPTSCTGFGSDAGDQALGIAVSQAGNVFIVGRAESGNFPTIDSIVSPQFGSNSSYPFVVKTSIAGNSLLYSTILAAENIGGTPADGNPYSALLSVAIDSTGNAYATGNAQSLGVGEDRFPVTTNYNNAFSGAVALKLTTPAPVTISLTSSQTSAEVGQSVVLTATPRNPDGSTPAGSVLFYSGSTQIGIITISGGTAVLSTVLPIGVHTVTAVYRQGGTEGVSQVVYQLVNSPADCE
jgi:hypothetical protein